MLLLVGGATADATAATIDVLLGAESLKEEEGGESS
tara:strand:- start:27 stop:134 length:108 start_codon:yes stop_codon:yes gene_type:complete